MAKIALYVKILFYIVNMGAVLRIKGVTCIQHTHNYTILVIGTYTSGSAMVRWYLKRR